MIPSPLINTRLDNISCQKCNVCRFAMIYHMSKEVARNRADTMPALPAVVNAAVAAKYSHLFSTILLEKPPPPLIHLEVENPQEDGVVESKEEERRLRRRRRRAFEASK